MKKPRIAVIGAGMAFEPHAKSLQDLATEVDLACVVARSPDTRAAVQSRYGFPVADSADKVWSDDSIHAVMILTPPNTHLELIRRAAEAQKHILLEKPLDISIDKARALVEICEQREVMLGTVFQYRYRESSMALYKALERRQLGNIVSLAVQIPWWRPQTYYDAPGRGTRERDGGGVLMTQAIHVIDLMLSLAGSVESVFSRSVTSALHRMETEDLVAAVLHFESGAIGTLHATTACYPGFPEQIRIMGTKGSATLEGDALQLRLMDGTQVDTGAPSVQGGGADPMAFSHASHRRLIQNFIDAVRTQSSPRPDGRDALRAQYLIEALLRSSDEGRPVKISAATPSFA